MQSCVKDDAKECSSTVLRIVRSYHDERGDWLAGLDIKLSRLSLEEAICVIENRRTFLFGREPNDLYIFCKIF